MDLSFRGEFNQKVDAKGRMSIPSAFRRVLEAGDPEFPHNTFPRLVLLYGPHLKNCLHVYAIDAMQEIEAGINRLPRGSKKRKYASRNILGKSWETTVDRDGRIILPKERRDQIELDGECSLVAMGDYFELWNAATYAEEDAAFDEAFTEEFGEDFDPLQLLEEE